MKKPKIAIVVSHPIQHFCPQYVSYASCEDWEIKVFFASALGYKAYDSPGFGTSVKWENLGLEKFPHVFLNNEEVIMTSGNLDAEDLDTHLAEYDPDALIIYGYRQKYQRRALKWGRKFEKKIFYISDSELRQRRNPITEIIKRLILKRYFKKVDAFLTVGNANEDFYSNYGVNSDNFFRTPFSIDINSYKIAYGSRSKIRVEHRASLGLEDDEIVCAVVGTLVPWKRQGDLIDAIHVLEQNSDNKFTAIIIGSGAMLEGLQEKAKKVKKNKIVFTKFVKPQDLTKYYAASDIYIHPAEKEPHSLAISEALYMKCPLIISDRCGSYGPDDDLQPEKNGFVYKCADIKELAGKMEILAANSELRKQFGEYSHSYGQRSQAISHYLGLKAALTANHLLS